MRNRRLSWQCWKRDFMNTCIVMQMYPGRMSRVRSYKRNPLAQMENTGGEPDVSNLHDGEQIVFVDFSKESPSGRRSLCYDEEALENRKANKPKNSALGLAREMGIELLTEEEYRKIQELEAFDLKTSTWVKTPEKIRKLGGAIFCDRRYDTVFTYHNGADSYYASRGFRGKLSVPKVK
jgi:hypothetical protein